MEDKACVLVIIINYEIMNIFDIINWRIRKYSLRKKLGAVQNDFFIAKDVTMLNPQCIYMQDGSSVAENVYLGPIVNYAGIEYSPKIIIGENTHIAKNGSIACIDRVEIGKNVLFARNVHITDHSHGYEDINRPITPQPLISKGPVIIEDDCWLGFNCEILSGVHIGKHCVVAARAVVTKDVPPYSIVAGNPARVVKQYNIETRRWEKIKK